jgi:hypothetical protein
MENEKKASRWRGSWSARTYLIIVSCVCENEDSLGKLGVFPYLLLGNL